MNRKWSNKQDAILIDFVRKHELLYNIKHDDYRNFSLKQQFWSEIAKILNKTEADCTKRWGYMRDYYVRFTKKTWTGSPGDEWRKRSKRLSFLNGLPSTGKRNITSAGVEDAGGENTQDISEGTSCQNSDTQEQIYDNNVGDSNVDKDIKYESSEYDSFDDEDINKDVDNMEDIYIKSEMNPKNISHSRERLSPIPQKSEQSLYTQDALDENDLFFSSMAKIVKRLPRYEQAKLRLEIGSLVGNVELRHIRNSKFVSK